MGCEIFWAGWCRRYWGSGISQSTTTSTTQQAAAICFLDVEYARSVNSRENDQRGGAGVVQKAEAEDSELAEEFEEESSEGSEKEKDAFDGVERSFGDFLPW